MGADIFKAWLGLAIAFCSFSSLGAPSSDHWDTDVWLVDARQAQQVIGVPANRTGLATSGAPISLLRVFRMSDPGASRLECCLRMTGTKATGNSFSIQSESKDRADRVPELLERSGGEPSDPYLGLAVAGGDAFVRNRRHQSFEVAWKDHAARIRVEHCVTQEGLRIEVTSATGRSRYYLPLGMDVEVPARDRCSD